MSSMKFPNPSLRSRIIIAVAAIALVHALFRWVPGYVERRPRFYEDAWKRANEILKEEVGAAAVENGVFYIPREKISVASTGGTWRRYEWAFMVLPSGDAFVGHPLDYLSADHPGKWARLSPDEAQQLLATFRYLLLARVRSVPESDSGESEGSFYSFDGRRMLPGPDSGDSSGPFHLFDGRHMLSEYEYSYHRYFEPLASLPGDAKANAAERVCRSLAESGEITFIESEDETAAALCRVVKYCRRIRNPFEAALLGYAARDLRQCPTADAVPALAKVKRPAGTFESRSDWQDTLEDIPVIGRFFGWDKSQDWRRVYVGDALWACENLVGKSEAERLAAYETALFSEERPRVSVPLFVEGYPAEFTTLVLKHWDSLSEDARSLYLHFAHGWGDGGRAIAERLADSEDLSVDSNCLLYEVTGERKYLTAALEAVRTPVDLAALNSDEHYELQTAFSQLAEIYKEDPSLEQVRERFISLWQSLSATGLEWHEMDDFDVEEICKGLLSAGGRENIEIAWEMIRKSDDKSEWPFPKWFFRALHADLWCAHDLLQSHDPLVADAILEFVRGELPELKRCAWLPLSRVLALKGDERLAVLLREALPRVEDGVPRTPYYRSPPEATYYFKSEILKGLITVVECINADDQVVFLLGLPDGELELVTDLGETGLLANYTEDQILAFMAEERCEPLLSLLYSTLLARRAEDTID
jgi:hypothetical protein